MFILDTDHLVVLQKRTGTDCASLVRRLSQYDQSVFFVTIVTFHEQIGGWQQYIARATTSSGVVRGYEKLENILTHFAMARVLSFTPAAADIFDELRKQRIRVATMDLRIAAIALAHRMTLLTRNTVDFQRIPHLPFEDWTVHE